MLRNTNVRMNRRPAVRLEKLPPASVTTDPAEFLLDRRKRYFHDRIRGVLFFRGPDKQPLPHRYMRQVIKRLPANLRPERYR